MREAKLFVLDDPGSIKTTETAWEEVYGIAEKAFSGWGGEQVLYLATNENPAAMAERLSPPSDPKGGERIVRRLLQITEQVEVKV